MTASRGRMTESLVLIISSHAEVAEVDARVHSGSTGSLDPFIAPVLGVPRAPGRRGRIGIDPPSRQRKDACRWTMLNVCRDVGIHDQQKYFASMTNGVSPKCGRPEWGGSQCGGRRSDALGGACPRAGALVPGPGWREATCGGTKCRVFQCGLPKCECPRCGSTDFESLQGGGAQHGAIRAGALGEIRVRRLKVQRPNVRGI